uniref:Uncharacterized protein n=1 Tax=Siphoviridae sp. ctj0M16 TaxID=2827918 RepID=A0A8S5S6X0_9CAUD|nr:MAG TPA: hypothetical protein [Siphoviridae sp. ctj0M16]
MVDTRLLNVATTFRNTSGLTSTFTELMVVFTIMQ